MFRVITSTHHQERIQLHLQHLAFVTPLLLSAAIVEELELVLWVVYLVGCNIGIYYVARTYEYYDKPFESELYMNIPPLLSKIHLLLPDQS
jgi:hypothetical protein